MSEVKRAGKDWHKIQPGDLIVCVKTHDALLYYPELIGMVGIFVKRGQKTSKKVESDLALIDGEVKIITDTDWEGADEND